MCGIVGFRTVKTDLPLEDLASATASLSHRGPDDSGWYLDRRAGVALGHRRLAVIDPTPAGRQPMADPSGDLVVACNGEIYNYKALRESLGAKGYAFHTETDTEVILAAYREWGIRCLDRFAGMFAFALWDRARRELILARDRVGIKPLYYYFGEGSFLFASELKALMAFRSFPRSVHPGALPLFLHYQYVPAPETIFRRTFKLPPAHWASYDGRDLRIRSYWALPSQGLDAESGCFAEDEAVEALDGILTKAVSDHLVSDVPLGSLLSGGIDSSIVTALMQKGRGTPVRTFSIGFEEPGYDEASWASQVARHLGTEHTELYVTPKDALAVIPKIPDIYDEPFGDSSAIPTVLVSRLARSRVTVALSGDGGDELFCGYVRYWATRAMAARFLPLPRPLRAALAALASSLSTGRLFQDGGLGKRVLPKRWEVANLPEKWLKLCGQMRQHDLTGLYRASIAVWPREELARLVRTPLPEGLFEQAFRETEPWPILSRLMRVDQMTYLPDAMLTKVDRAGMSAALEVRVPLLDHRVLEFAAALPESLQYRNGAGKYLLRQLLRRYVPPFLFERPKTGFAVPIGNWLRRDLKEMLLDYLSPQRLKAEGLFHTGLVEAKIREHMAGGRNHQHPLWSLLMWEMWRERWLGRSNSTPGSI